MTDLRQAAQQALEALENGKRVRNFEGGTKYQPTLEDDAITTLRSALEQQAEPVAVYGYCPACGAKGVTRERRPNGNDKCTNGHTYPSSTALKQQAEPICYASINKQGDVCSTLKQRDSWRTVPLYTTPPQRQWVGLTDEDMKDPKTHILDFICGARWAEAKLKERNNG